ncbi:MAG: GGDEF domain-containing protein [Candidatus Dormibacteria bacterium]
MAQPFTGQERRDGLARDQRNALAKWLDLDPRTLGLVSGEAIGALGLALEANRAAGLRIRQLRRATTVLRDQVGVLQQQTLADPLTGVASRRALELRLEHECAMLRRTGIPFAVFVLDANSLKQVNDLWGHGSGDAFLRELAARLLVSVRGVDMVARLGGDEFVLVCPHASETSAADLAGRLSVALGKPMTAGPQGEIPMSVSTGWAIAEPGATPGQLLQRADEAMYRAKTNRTATTGAEDRQV